MLRTSEFIVNFLLNSCWQIAVIVAVAAVLSRLLKNGPARYRHVLWIFALAASLVVPLLTATHYVPEWISRTKITTVPSAVAPGRSDSIGSTVRFKGRSHRHEPPHDDDNYHHVSQRPFSYAGLRACYPCTRNQNCAFLAAQGTTAPIRDSRGPRG